VSKEFEKSHGFILKQIGSALKSSDFQIQTFSKSAYHQAVLSGLMGGTEFVYEITEQGFAALSAQLIGKDLHSIRIGFLEQFKRERNALANDATKISKPQWLIDRQKAKKKRDWLTTVIHDELIPYAEKKGSKNPNMFYITYTRMIYSALYQNADNQNRIRKLLTPKQLKTLSKAEFISGQAIQAGISRKLAYQEIYLEAKHRVTQFANNIGQTRIIEQQSLGFEFALSDY
jgi:phage regulator Rha-like protein